VHAGGVASRARSGRSTRRERRIWGLVAAAVAVMAGVAAGLLVGSYRYPDRPQSPGWLAVYGWNITQNADGTFAFIPFPVPTFEGRLTVRRDGDTFRARFTVAAPHLGESDSNASGSKAAQIMILGGGDLAQEPLTPLDRNTFSAPLGVQVPVEPDALQEITVYPARVATPPRLPAIMCVLGSANEVCGVEASWPVSLAESKSFQRTTIRLPTMQPPSLPGLQGQGDPDELTYPTLVAESPMPIPQAAAQVRVTAALRPGIDEDLLRLRVDTGFPAVTASGVGLTWAAEVATPSTPVEPQVVTTDPTRERWAQAALILGGALMAICLGLIWEAIRLLANLRPPT
jgi:hypothetical protein